MDDARDNRVRDILEAATRQPRADQTAFLHDACGSDQDLLAEVQSLLSALQEDQDFLEVSAIQRLNPAALGPKEQAGTRIGRYQLLDLIGEGGFGSVFRARQEHPVRREVALKVIKLGMDTKQVIARFEAERQALAMMDHPNIAKVLDAGTTDTGRPYFVMELVKGIPITEYCDTEKLSTKQRLELFIPVCMAVQHAHTKGIIHRDLKPSNVLVTLADGKPIPKVIDFGIAKATNARLTERTYFTEFRQFVGTPEYMSPEQAEMTGIDIDTRSDIYSLGVLLYELLTGTTPFDAKQLRELAYDQIQKLIREVDPPKPSTRLSSIGDTLSTVAQKRRTEPRKLRHVVKGELDWIVMRCLEKERSRRYETASGFAADIRRYLDGEPVTAAPPSRVYRLRKVIRRNKGILAAGTVVALVLVLGIIGTSIGMVRARIAADISNQQKLKSEALSSFMRGILAHARPGYGGNLRVAVLLRLASKDIDRALNGYPEAEVEARETLALTYYRLGLFDDAQFENDRAYALSAALDRGDVSPRTLRLAGFKATILFELRSDDEPLQLARQAFEQARTKFGVSHPVTYYCALCVANKLLLRGQPAEAESILRNAMAHTPEVVYDGMSTAMVVNNLTHALILQGRTGDEAVGLLRPLIQQIKSSPASEPVDMVNAQINLGACLADQGKRDEALACFHDALIGPREQLGAAHTLTRWATFTYAHALQTCGRWSDAMSVLDENVRMTQSEEPGDSEVLAIALVERGLLQLFRHEQKGIQDVLDGSQMRQRVLKTLDSDAQSDLRLAILGKLGSWECPSDGRMAAQIYCALDEMLSEHPADLLEWANALSPSDVQYRLYRWRESNHAPISAGTLADVAPVRDVSPGIYSLELEVPRHGATPIRRSGWVLFAPWQVTIHYDRGPSLAPIDLRPVNEPSTWESEIACKPAGPQRTVGSLAFMTPLKASPAPDGRETDFGIVARTTMELPVGRYRFAVTSDDGVRLYVDGRRVIDDWTLHPPRQDTADLDLNAGGHDVKVEYFQGCGSYELWVRVEPLKP